MSGEFAGEDTAATPVEAGEPSLEFAAPEHEPALSPTEQELAAGVMPAEGDRGDCTEHEYGKGAEPDAPEPGDLVRLGPGAPPEYRSLPAIITKVAESHCTVAMLDEALSLGIGECWPMLGDITVESRCWRIGSRVVVDGLRSGKAIGLNGFAGTVAAHPREGHPSFIRKPSAPDQAQLVICVLLDDPAAAGRKSVLLEPKFLVPYGKFLDSIVTGPSTKPALDFFSPELDAMRGS